MSRGRLLVWDAACIDIFAPSNVPFAVTDTDVGAAKADSTYLFVPVDVDLKEVLDHMLKILSGNWATASREGGGGGEGGKPKRKIRINTLYTRFL